MSLVGWVDSTSTKTQTILKRALCWTWVEIGHTQLMMKGDLFIS